MQNQGPYVFFSFFFFLTFLSRYWDASHPYISKLPKQLHFHEAKVRGRPSRFELPPRKRGGEKKC